MNKKFVFVIIVWVLSYLPIGAMPMERSVFARLFDKARLYSETFPAEKVFLHFDNTSYYQGDSIWIKAYVVNACNDSLSNISKPLYVELVDQLGNIVDRRIVKLSNGEGQCCIPLDNAFFTGYFEVRAFTKWMLGFNPSSYFSQVIPIYNKRKTLQEQRSIANYGLDNSMNKRPVVKEQSLSMRFFPEGGQLIRGLPSMVAFETESKDSGLVDIKGILYDENGKALMPIASLHNGIGSFMYSPGDKPSYIQVEYKGKEYKFLQPLAADSGYVMHVDNRDSVLELSVSRKYVENKEPVALFVFSKSVPLLYHELDFKNNNSVSLDVDTKGLSAGVCHILLVNSTGKVICDRPCFIYPSKRVNGIVSTDKSIYKPYEKIICKLKFIGDDHKPIRNARLSMSVRNDILSDYREYDNDVTTEFALTSELKGYIESPHYYLIDKNVNRRRQLDNLLLVRAMGKYDYSSIYSGNNQPKYMPEDRLELTGQVKSLFGKLQKNLNTSFVLRKDSSYYAGMITTDSTGSFKVPIDNLEGVAETFIQTKKDGKQNNRWANVLLSRNFAPALKTLDFQETHPLWDNKLINKKSILVVDSAYNKSLADNAVILDDVVVLGKKKLNVNNYVKIFNRNLLGYYDVRRFLDNERDNGREIMDLPDLLQKLNNNIHVNMSYYSDADTSEYNSNRSDAITYRNVPITFYVNGQKVGFLFIRNDIDKIKSMCFYKDNTGNDDNVYNISGNDITRKQQTDYWSGMQLNNNHDINSVNDAVICSISTDDNWDAERNNGRTRGIRHTYVQGYSAPCDFHSPQYETEKIDASDKRRTLYWNPNLSTDNNGEVTIELYNSSSTSSVLIDAALYDKNEAFHTCYDSYSQYLFHDNK